MIRVSNHDRVLIGEYRGALGKPRLMLPQIGRRFTGVPLERDATEDETFFIHHADTLSIR